MSVGKSGRCSVDSADYDEAPARVYESHYGIPDELISE